MHSLLNIILHGTIYCLIAIAGIVVGYSASSYKDQPTESHENCHDSVTHEAWIARKNGQARCFLEGRAFPHKVKAGNFD